MANPTDFSFFFRYNGTWNDHTSDLNLSDPVTITMGQPNEHGKATPCEITATLDDQEAKFLPDNAEGSLYGDVGLGTHVMVCQGSPDVSLRIYQNAVIRSGAFTTDKAALGITGDLDIRWEGAPDEGFTSGRTQILASHWDETNDDKAWKWGVDATGHPFFQWTEDGDNNQTVTSSNPIIDQTEHALRVTIDVDDGSSQHVVTFYESTSISDPWSPLDSDTRAGTTSIWDSSTNLVIGAAQDSTKAESLTGKVRAFQVRDGIGGSTVVDADFQSRGDVGIYGMTDFDGNAWVPFSYALIEDESTRAVAESASFKPVWDNSGHYLRCQYRAMGVMSRLGRTTKIEAKSLLYRYLRSRPETVGYWPMEDGPGASIPVGAESVRAGINPPPPLHKEWGFLSEWSPGVIDAVPGSDPVASIGQTLFRYAVPSYTPNNDQQQMSIFLHFPDGWQHSSTGTVTSEVAEHVILMDNNEFLAAGLRVFVSSPPDYTLWYWLRNKVTGFTHRFDSMSLDQDDLNGATIAFTATFSNNGSDIDVRPFVHMVQDPTGVRSPGTEMFTTLNTVSGVNVERCYDGFIGNGANDVETGEPDLGFGHVVSQDTPVGSGNLGVQLSSIVAQGYPNEVAHERVERLMFEEQQPNYIPYDTDEVVELEPQARGSSLTLARDSARGDAALLVESRHAAAVVMRPRKSRRNRIPVMTFTDTNGRVRGILNQVTDLSQVFNSLTVRQPSGGRDSYAKKDGPRNTNSAVDDDFGIGLFVNELAVPIADSSELRSYASFFVHVATTGYPRISALTIELEHHSDLLDEVRELHIGDWVRLEVSDLKGAKGIYDFIVFGWKEVLGQETHRFTMNLGPAETWKCIRLDDPDKGRLQATDSFLDSSIDSTQTSFAVGWSSDGEAFIDSGSFASLFPFDIVVGGERMTVSDITAPSGSLQTFTVTRSVNHIVKSHSSGARVKVWVGRLGL